MVLVGEECIGDVLNVFFLNGWIVDDDGKVFIYYVLLDICMYVVILIIEWLVDYCLYIFQDGFFFLVLVEILKNLIE